MYDEMPLCGVPLVALYRQPPRVYRYKASWACYASFMGLHGPVAPRLLSPGRFVQSPADWDCPALFSTGE
jgi:hypothetical protein